MKSNVGTVFILTFRAYAMGWFKQVLRLNAAKNPKMASPQSSEFELPLSLAMGSRITLKAGLKDLLEGATDIIVPDASTIMAIGTLDTGSGFQLIRCYLENEDYFIQFLMNGPRASDIASVILFGYHEVRALDSQTELARLIGAGSKIGMPYYELERTEYVRQWGTEDGQTEMAVLTEQVVNAEHSYTVEHQCMLYARNLHLANRREFLLFSLETDEPAHLSLTTSVGVTLHLCDITLGL